MNRKWAAALLVTTMLASLLAVGSLPRQRSKAQRSPSGPGSEPQLVTLVQPKPGKEERTVSLPGSLEGLANAAIHARASGFVRRRLVDLGDNVQRGQLLAELDTPELDREIEQAEAALAQSGAAIELSRAALTYSKSSLQRIQLLDGRKLSSKQELEQLEAQQNVDAAKLQVAEAGKAAATANLHRLRQLKSFSRVVAPFAGTITARNVEQGGLVVAGAGAPLFALSTLDPLRVFVEVPQGLALGVAPGNKARVSVPELPDLTVDAAVTRTARALDPKSRTLRVEVQLPNSQGKLLAGMYAHVEMSLPNQRVLTLPATALITRSEGVQVAVVDAAQHVTLQPVVIARDNGAEVEIASGLTADQRVVANPGPGITQGSIVRARPSAPKVVARQ